MDNKDGTWGMLWRMDDPKKSLTENIDIAIIYFIEKYKQTPIYVECSNKDSDQKSFKHNDIEIVSQRYFGHNYIWIRMENETKI